MKKIVKYLSLLSTVLITSCAHYRNQSPVRAPSSNIKKFLCLPEIARKISPSASPYRLRKLFADSPQKFESFVKSLHKLTPDNKELLLRHLGSKRNFTTLEQLQTQLFTFIKRKFNDKNLSVDEASELFKYISEKDFKAATNRWDMASVIQKIFLDENIHEQGTYPFGETFGPFYSRLNEAKKALRERFSRTENYERALFQVYNNYLSKPEEIPSNIGLILSRISKNLLGDFSDDHIEIVLKLIKNKSLINDSEEIRSERILEFLSDSNAFEHLLDVKRSNKSESFDKILSYLIHGYRNSESKLANYFEATPLPMKMQKKYDRYMQTKEKVLAYQQDLQVKTDFFENKEEAYKKIDSVLHQFTALYPRTNLEELVIIFNNFKRTNPDFDIFEFQSVGDLIRHIYKIEAADPPIAPLLAEYSEKNFFKILGSLKEGFKKELKMHKKNFATFTDFVSSGITITRNTLWKGIKNTAEKTAGCIWRNPILRKDYLINTAIFIGVFNNNKNKELKDTPWELFFNVMAWSLFINNKNCVAATKVNIQVGQNIPMSAIPIKSRGRDLVTYLGKMMSVNMYAAGTLLLMKGTMDYALDRDEKMDFQSFITQIPTMILYNTLWNPMKVFFINPLKLKTFTSMAKGLSQGSARAGEWTKNLVMKQMSTRFSYFQKTLPSLIEHVRKFGANNIPQYLKNFYPQSFINGVAQKIANFPKVLTSQETFEMALLIVIDKIGIGTLNLIEYDYVWDGGLKLFELPDKVYTWLSQDMVDYIRASSEQKIPLKPVEATDVELVPESDTGDAVEKLDFSIKSQEEEL
ncbi:MAG: hypothetical protein ACPGJV_00745 [Bacteriovoracaceae bacterium]